MACEAKQKITVWQCRGSHLVTMLYNYSHSHCFEVKLAVVVQCVTRPVLDVRSCTHRIRGSFTTSTLIATGMYHNIDGMVTAKTDLLENMANAGIEPTTLALLAPRSNQLS